MIKRLARLLTIDPFYGFACEMDGVDVDYVSHKL